MRGKIVQRKISVMLFILILLIFSSSAVDHHRWKIKTSVAQKTRAHKVELKDLLSLPDPPDVSMNDSRYETKRIPVFDNDLNVKEGALLNIKGYLHLVAHEKNDGDYHIQISESPTSGNNCLIVEVPDPENVTDPFLKQHFDSVRSFIRRRLLKGREPGEGGNIMIHQVYVHVKGQLFYDASHNHNQARGKRGMKSKTLWELHPVIDIGFEPKPN